jgi:hypothetical protein
VPALRALAIGSLHRRPPPITTASAVARGASRRPPVAMPPALCPPTPTPAGPVAPAVPTAPMDGCHPHVAWPAGTVADSAATVCPPHSAASVPGSACGLHQSCCARLTLGPPLSSTRSASWLVRSCLGLGPAKPRLYLQHDVSESASEHRLVLRLRCNIPHNFRCRYPFFHVCALFSTSFHNCCR